MLCKKCGHRGSTEDTFCPCCGEKRGVASVHVETGCRCLSAKALCALILIPILFVILIAAGAALYISDYLRQSAFFATLPQLEDTAEVSSSSIPAEESAAN